MVYVHLFFIFFVFIFFFNDTATTEIYTRPYTLSLHDALPISPTVRTRRADGDPAGWAAGLGENHHRGEARAAVEARAKGAGAGGGGSLSAGGGRTTASAW